MEAIQIISQDLFDKVRSRFSNLEMGDKTGAVTIDPAEARFFDFDFVHEGIDLGRVSISLNDLGSLKVYYSQGITENQNDPAKKLWYGFLKEMRRFAMRRLLRFDTRDIAKTNLDKNDFQHLAATQGPKDNDMQMNESRWNNKSTRKTSRAVKGATEVIVRHRNPVDETIAGSRSRRNNIKAIFIQNRDGERFKYPFIHPAGAFAMAQHVDHGGVPHDPAGKAIIKMSEQIAQLQEFQRKVQHQTLHDDATGITERAVGRLHELKSCIEALGKRGYYENWIAEFSENDTVDDGLELDDVTMEEYKQKFTQNNFKEELAAYFPLLHRIMKETNKVDIEDYVKEENKSDKKYKVHCSQCGGEFMRSEKQGFSHCKDHAGMKNYDAESVERVSFEDFEQWADNVEQGKLSDDQIEDLKIAMEKMGSEGEKLKLGPDGEVAWQFFSNFGLDDSDLKDKLNMAANVDEETDPVEVLQVWARENYPELLVALGMSGTADKPEEEPKENDDMSWTNNTMSAIEGKADVVKEVAKIVKSFYNAANEDVGPFRSQESILLDVEKTIREKYGDKMAKRATKMAEALIEKLVSAWEQRHGKSAEVGADVQDDGLARLKELLGNVKSKVESIEQGPKKSEVPAFKRKDQGGDWKTSTSDLEKERERNISGPEGLKALKARTGTNEGEITDIRKLAGLAK